jgi:hypothetical protein
MGVDEDDMNRSCALNVGDKIKQTAISAVPLTGRVAGVGDVVAKAVREKLKIAQPFKARPQAEALPTPCTHANYRRVSKAGGKSLPKGCPSGKLLAQPPIKVEVERERVRARDEVVILCPLLGRLDFAKIPIERTVPKSRA